MRKLWRCCYYASGSSEGASERYLDFGLPEFERFLFSCISTTGMEIEVVGADMSRFEKLSAVSRFPEARKHLHSCSMSADNCSRCDGCSLDMLSLDALGRLDAFSGTYDVAFYRGHRDRYFRLMMSRKGDPLFAQAYAAFRKKGDPELSGMERVAAAIDRFDSLWKEGSEESCSRAVEILTPFSSDPHAALRRADAYASGKGVKKDRDKERRLRGTAADHLKREAEDGFVCSGERLFDILWDMGGRDDELMGAVVPGVQADSPYSKACMSRMCAEGRGVEKDEDAAIMWMKEAAEGDPGRFSADYCGMLLGSKDPGRHSLAAEYCRSQIGIREDPALLAMLSEMCSKGKGTDRDQAEAVRLMRRAAAKDPSYETRYCRALLDSDAHADHREAFEICSRLCKGRGGPDAWAMMAEMYSEGKGVTKNVVEASRWMRKAAEARPSRLSYEFCRMLQSSGVPELEEEAFRLSEDRYEKTGSDMYLAIIARACRDGKGTEKDIPKAVECMKKAVRSSSKYLREYCELLLASDREEDHAEAHRICSGIYKKSGTPFSCLAIATMYRDGKGVGKDLDKAMTWFGRDEDAAGSSDDLAYCDFVLAADDEGLHEAAWNICSERYKATGSSAYSGRIARMYRDGKGVGKDLEKAVEWMERSYTDDPDAWGEEFNDLLSKVG